MLLIMQLLMKSQVNVTFAEEEGGKKKMIIIREVTWPSLVPDV